jgi:hypothetical protein
MLDPREPGASEFHEAILGLVRLCAELDALIDGEAEGTQPALGPPASVPAFDHALLGLFSLRKTLVLAFGAVLGEPAVGAAPAETNGAQSAWDRGHLR